MNNSTHTHSRARILSTHKLDFDGNISCRCQPVDKVEPLGVDIEQIPAHAKGEKLCQEHCWFRKNSQINQLCYTLCKPKQFDYFSLDGTVCTTAAGLMRQ